jgi:hypothetical protein
MNKGVVENLRRVELFSGLSDEELLQIATICKVRRIGAEKRSSAKEMTATSCLSFTRAVYGL